MKRLVERAERIARKMEAETLRRMIEELSSSGLFADVEPVPEGIAVKGRRLTRRWLETPDLRFWAGGRR